MDHRHPLVAIRNIFRVTSFIGLIFSIIFFLKRPQDSIIPSNFCIPEQIFNKKCQYTQYPTMEVFPEALHAEELTSNLIKLLVFPQHNLAVNNCHISKFGLNAHNHTTYIEIEPNYQTESPLIKNLLSEDALVTSKRHTRTLIQILTTTKHVWLYLLFVVLRYHEAFSSAISPSALPPYDTIFQECLDAFKNCDKLNDAVFQMFLIHKRHMAEHSRLRLIEYGKRLNRTDILPATSTSNDTPINETNNENDVNNVAQESALTTTNMSTSVNENVDGGADEGADEGTDEDADEDANVGADGGANEGAGKNVDEDADEDAGEGAGEGADEDAGEGANEDADKGADEGADDRANQYSSRDNEKAVSTKSNSSDGDDNGNNSDTTTENATFSPSPASNSLKGSEAFPSKRLDSFADTKNPSRIPLPFGHGKDKKASSQEYGPFRRNSYLQEYIDNQQLEAIAEAEDELDEELEQESEQESEQEPEQELEQEPEQEQESGQEPEQEPEQELEQDISQQRQEESKPEPEDNEQTANVQDNDEQDGHVEEESIQQLYTQHNNTSNPQQSNLPDIQQNWPLHVEATTSVQEITVNGVHSNDLHLPTNIPTSSAPSHQTSSTHQISSSSFVPAKKASSEPRGTSSRSASGRRHGVSFQDSPSIYRYTTHQENSSSSQAETFKVNDEDIFNKDIYDALKISRAATRINSLAELGVYLKHYEIDLMDPRFYYNPDGTDNLYDGPKEIAEKLGVQYTGSNIAVVCKEPHKCEICTKPAVKPAAKRKAQRFF